MCINIKWLYNYSTNVLIYNVIYIFTHNSYIKDYDEEDFNTSDCLEQLCLLVKTLPQQNHFTAESFNTMQERPQNLISLLEGFIK